mmetsp:Transcript_11508/g.28663  ORF Transcript_11508/g.28663 Transcript_11508/m.28663 type:complete len:705 (+) Transcript_11508:4177-6291(+)
MLLGVLGVPDLLHVLQSIARNVSAGEARHVGGDLEQKHALAGTHLEDALGLVGKHPVARDTHPLLNHVAGVHQVGERVEVGSPVHGGVGVLLIGSRHVLVHGAVDVPPHLDPPLLLNPGSDGLVVELARSVDGQRVTAHHPLRGKVRLGQLVRKGVVELLGGDGVVWQEGGDADEEAVDGLNGHHLDHALQALVRHTLNLSELKAHAANLDLAIRTAKVLKEALLGVHAANVTSAVDVATRRVELVGHKALRSQLRALKVAHGNLDPPDADLAPLALGHLLGGVLKIRDVHGNPLVRKPEREARRRVLVHLGIRRVTVQRRHIDRRLGGAVEVPQLDVLAQHLLELGVVGAEKRLSDAVDKLEALGASLAARSNDALGVVKEEVQKRRDKHAGGDVSAVHGGEDSLGIQMEVSTEHAGGGAEHQSLPDLGDRHVKRVDRLHQEHVLRRAVLDLEGLDGAVPEARRGHRHTLGPTRAARRVHDVHALVGRQLPPGASELRLRLLDEGLRHVGSHLDGPRRVDAHKRGLFVGGGSLLRVGDDGQGLELVEDAMVALDGPLGVERRKGEAGLEDGELRDGHRRAPGKNKRDHGALGARRRSAQDGRNLLSTLVHLGVRGHPRSHLHDILGRLGSREVEQARSIGAPCDLCGKRLLEGQTSERRRMCHTPGSIRAGRSPLNGPFRPAHGGIACGRCVASLMNRRHLWS